jgi:aspartyl-tRNA(Asn)/glutamyl-tRNA(Gln) amidotransferase subunit C
MQISIEQIEHIASLARLKLTEEEKQNLPGEMSDIISFADTLNELDTTGIEPTTHAIFVSNVFREDEWAPSYQTSDILRNAPRKDKTSVVVPNIIE